MLPPCDQIAKKLEEWTKMSGINCTGTTQAPHYDYIFNRTLNTGEKTCVLTCEEAQSIDAAKNPEEVRSILMKVIADLSGV